MTTLRIENFAGIAPRWSNRLLPQNGAVRADNCKLLSGELRGLRQTQPLFDFGVNGGVTVARAYRLPATVGAPIPLNNSDFWLGFSNPDVDFVRTPVLEDSFERYYWTSDTSQHGGVPQYNTRARIQAGSVSYVLGIPAPVNAPTVTPPAGTDVVRSYVYTFVSAYGEEGAPSPPKTATGTAGSWSITGMDTTVPSSANYNLAKTRIYRTVAGATGTEYFWVADVTFGTSTFTDTQADAVVALNFTMQSLTWDPPPQTLKGLVPHPGGFLIGFTGRDLYMSAPYQPHAWPVENIQTCQTEIVGVSVYNNTIIVATTSHPYYGDGMSPSAVTLQKIESIDPCVSRRSMATTTDGVYYASPQGIIKATDRGTTLVTYQLFTREEWQLYFSPTSVQAVPYGLQYIAFDSTATGFIFSPAEQLAPLTTLDRFVNVQTIQIDAYSGDVFIVQGNQVRLWDPPTSTPYSYTWTSKEFDLPKPVNFGAMRLKFAGTPLTVPLSALTDYTNYNNARFAIHPLAPINSFPINGARKVTLPPPNSLDPQNRGAINGSTLYPVDAFRNVNGGVTVNIYARDLEQEWVRIFNWSVTSERIFRLPAGLKSDGWQVQLIGNVSVYSISLAETGKELEQV
jgi:hypothetical protein